MWSSLLTVKMAAFGTLVSFMMVILYMYICMLNNLITLANFFSPSSRRNDSNVAGAFILLWVWLLCKVLKGCGSSTWNHKAIAEEIMFVEEEEWEEDKGNGGISKALVKQVLSKVIIYS